MRNAVDHGVEKTGKITLKAKREKDFVTIVVEDDGQGVNWKEVVSSALEKGIISNKQSEELLHTIDTQEADSWKKSVASLLYNPQLSTKKKVTETSGRGVGLSVVKKFMESIGGNIMLESPTTKDGGTRFVLELPLTLAIVNALLVRIQSSVFAIPFSSIERVVSITSDDIKSVADQDVAVIDGDHVPLVNLERIFNLDVQKDIKKEMFESYALKERKNEVTDQVEKKISNKEEKKKTQTVVLTRRGKEVAGIEVDELLNEQEIIVKPLPSILHGVKGFSGSTILGDGEVVLILDVVSLLSDSNQLVRI
ncbi:hypothetical protein C0581_02470 [Candidatus Parcubacteria bacterium]|nr:MAG: hypothetical protein C0581_02470 [Candidatus Parcubacteria bacterium]